jgi:DNA-binding NarL/FixJ family response regulator
MATVMTDFAYVPAHAGEGAISATLTARELEVLRLMADGLSTKQIAARLEVSFKTAACHRYRVLQKLCVDSTVIAVRLAIRQGLVEP